MNVILCAQSNHSVSLYGKVEFCKISTDEKIIISPTKTGEMFFEQLQYSLDDFNENSLVFFLLSKNSFEIEDTVWKKDVTLVKNFPCKARFLNAGDEIIDKNETTLYRLDVKPLEDISDKEPDILNAVLLKSSIIKVWVSKESNNIVKISVNYKGLEYVITQSKRLDE